MVPEDFNLVLATDKMVEEELRRIGFNKVQFAKRFAGFPGEDIFDAHYLVAGGLPQDDPSVDKGYANMVGELKMIARRIVKKLEGVVQTAV